jgi:hypothetical protein
MSVDEHGGYVVVTVSLGSADEATDAMLRWEDLWGLSPRSDIPHSTSKVSGI